MDEWPVGDHYITGRAIRQSTTTADRAVEAKQLVERFDFNWPLAIDEPEQGNSFMNTYGAWPTCFYIVNEGKLFYIAEPAEDHKLQLDKLISTLYSLLATKNVVT